MSPQKRFHRLVRLLLVLVLLGIHLLSDLIPADTIVHMSLGTVDDPLLVAQVKEVLINLHAFCQTTLLVPERDVLLLTLSFVSDHGADARENTSALTQSFVSDHAASAQKK